MRGELIIHLLASIRVVVHIVMCSGCTSEGLQQLVCESDPFTRLAQGIAQADLQSVPAAEIVRLVYDSPQSDQQVRQDGYYMTVQNSPFNIEQTYSKSFLIFSLSWCLKHTQ